jgi:CSLREA domain-containing protein
MMSLFHRKLAIFFILFCVMAVAPSYAATITVDTNVDELDANGAGNGNCSLREAIQNANNDDQNREDCVQGAGTDTINLGGLTYNLDTLTASGEDAAATGDLDILDDVNIDGQGATIDGNATDRVFDIRPGGFTVQLSDMTIQNGLIAADGGGIYNNGGTLTLDAVTLDNNQSTGNSGGGIYSDAGALTIQNGSVISNNSANSSGGGVVVLNNGNITIADSTISGNAATTGSGGGVLCNACNTVNISNSTFRGNVANAGNGGGFWNISRTPANITTSLFTDNSSAFNGGAILHYSGTLNITDTTFNASSGANRATIDGGCIWTRALLNLTRVTMTGCTAGDEGGGLYVNSNTTTISNSLIKANTAGGAGKGGGIYANTGTAIVDTTYVIYNNTEDCVDGGGGITDNGGNFDSDGTCSTFARYVPPSSSTYTLSVYATGAVPAGMGRVYSDPAGIDCPGTCSATFDDGTEITLYTQNRNGMEFFRWEGACAAVWRGDPCVLTMDEYKEVPVRFYPPTTQSSSDSGSGTDSDGNGPPFFDGSGSWLLSPINGSAGVPTTYPFIWSNLTDPDGNPITYDLLFCDGFESGNCTSWSASSRLAGQKADNLFAGFGALSGIVLFGFLLGGGMRSRGGRAFLLAMFFITAGFTITACSSSGSDISDSTTTTGDESTALTCDSVEEGQQCLVVTGLTPNTNYYWKVAASDGNGGTLESEIWSFTTGE